MIKLFLLSLIFFLLSGAFSLVFGKNNRLATLLGAWGCVVSCVLGLIPAFSVFLSGRGVAFAAPWAVPYGSFSLAIDPLSAFFLVPIFFLSALAAIYGSRYLEKWYGKKAMGTHWLFFNLLIASMALVVTARNAVLFLFAWEVMSVASFFLVTFENEKEKVRSAGMIYLVATHIGTAFLLVMFILLAKASGSMEFSSFVFPLVADASLVFLFAVIGFGTKAGLMPFHVWLPEAHPAAPSHVSAVMSGVMIKTGIYGIVRIISFLGIPLAWWGWTLIAIGAVSGVLGVLFAMAQHDIKRLLAYHSVENIGIITLGLGVGCVGLSSGMPVLAVLGFAGALFHVVNHAVFKGLLFLAAGSVVWSSGTHEIDELGGVMKRMRWTGMGFLVGSAAISGLPPLNGFMSEFLIYLGSFQGVFHGHMPVVPCLVVITALALIGGLAAACFAKAASAIFLGEPRSEHATRAKEVPAEMWVPVLLLGGLCFAIGLGAPFIVRAMLGVLSCAFVLLPGAAAEGLGNASSYLANVSLISAGLLCMLGIILLLRKIVLSKRPVRESVTWDCGYAAPSSSMQYTASSFAQPLIGDFRVFLRTRRKAVLPEGFFPKKASVETHTPDIFQESIYGPAFRKLYSFSQKMKRFQHGRLQAYVLYIIITLFVLLVWKLR